MSQEIQNHEFRNKKGRLELIQTRFHVGDLLAEKLVPRVVTQGSSTVDFHSECKQAERAVGSKGCTNIEIQRKKFALSKLNRICSVDVGLKFEDQF